MKKSVLSVFLLLMLAIIMFATTQAETIDRAGLMVESSLEGIIELPENIQNSQAAFSIRYSFPQFAETDASIEQINQSIAQICNFLISAAQSRGESADLVCEITHNSEKYLSVLVHSFTVGGFSEHEELMGFTFANGFGGQPLVLSRLMNCGVEFARERVYSLMWEIITAEMHNEQNDYLDHLTLQALKEAFDPETMFYLDEDENIVFFIKAGEIAGEIAGIKVFPFSIAELQEEGR